MDKWNRSAHWPHSRPAIAASAAGRAGAQHAWATEGGVKPPIIGQQVTPYTGIRQPGRDSGGIVDQVGSTADSSVGVGTIVTWSGKDTAMDHEFEANQRPKGDAVQLPLVRLFNTCDACRAFQHNAGHAIRNTPVKT